MRDKLDAARRRPEAQARAREEAERGAYEARLAAREKRRGRARGKHPKPPEETPGPNEQSNLSDPDSRLMRKSRNHEYRQAYNAQAVVDADGSQLILSARVSQCASDRNELVSNVEAKGLARNAFAHVRTLRFENRGDGEGGAACNVWNMIESGDYSITEFVEEK